MEEGCSGIGEVMHMGSSAPMTSDFSLCSSIARGGMGSSGGRFSLGNSDALSWSKGLRGRQVESVDALWY